MKQVQINIDSKLIFRGKNHSAWQLPSSALKHIVDACLAPQATHSSIKLRGVVHVFNEGRAEFTSSKNTVSRRYFSQIISAMPAKARAHIAKRAVAQVFSKTDEKRGGSANSEPLYLNFDIPDFFGFIDFLDISSLSLNSLVALKKKVILAMAGLRKPRKIAHKIKAFLTISATSSSVSFGEKSAISLLQDGVFLLSKSGLEKFDRRLSDAISSRAASANEERNSES